MGVKIWPYAAKSKSAKYLAAALSEKLGYKVIRTVKQAAEDDIVINWGSSHCSAKKVLNPATLIPYSTNKIKFFEKCSKAEKTNIRIPKWTTSPKVAAAWIADGLVYGRGVINGHSGIGIILIDNPAKFQLCPLYTQAVPNTHEYRIHVFQHKPLFRIKKVHPHPTHEQQLVRNLHHGWKFVHVETAPVPVIEQACEVSKYLNLDFGAVDIIYNNTTETATVLEINTAPGIGPNTCTIYADAFVKFIKEVA
jgi:hypothetical protein